MKAAANGALNLSTLDGWWDEVWRDPANPRGIGWAIGKGESYSDPGYQDQVEAEALYDLLERDVIPTFYDRGADRLPRKWIERMKASIGNLCDFVNTHRMVSEYARRFYSVAHAHFEDLNANDAARARALTAWLERVGREWPHVRVESIRGGGATLLVHSVVRVRATVQLGALTDDDVTVELYMGQLDKAGEITGAAAIPMKPVESPGKGQYVFEVETPCERSGLQGYTIRVRPRHNDLAAAAFPGLICWMDPAAASAVGQG
jgi:starch phosphorylase